MPKNKNKFKIAVFFPGIVLAVSALAFFSVQKNKNLEGRLLPQAETKQPDIVTISPETIEAGTVFPARSLIRFTVPETVNQIHRKVFLGFPDEEREYWGVCRKKNSDSYHWFLSEKLQAAYETNNLNPVSDSDNSGRLTASLAGTTEAEITNQPQYKIPTIRHVLDVLEGGMDCLSNAQEIWHVGPDTDGDLLNDALEIKVGSNKYDKDTDSDGLEDGLEMKIGTLVTDKDSDRDGLPDGLEDKNGNGRVDYGETSPLNPDSDGDGLWDGAKTTYKKKQKTEGEDLNFNGIVDKANPATGAPCETSPVSSDTDGDGIGDRGDPNPC